MNKKLSNWGNYPVTESPEYFTSSIEDLSQKLNTCTFPFIPRGNGRCYGDSSLSDTVISSLHLDHIISFDRKNGIFECEAGLLLDQILMVIVPKGWFLPVTPGTKFITVGGAIASDVHGKNHHIEGSFCDYVIELDLMLSTGEVITCSAFKNSDLFEVVRGGMGLTGFILRVKFKLKKVPSAFIHQKQVKAENFYKLMDLFDEFKDYTYTMAWIDCLKGGDNFGRSVFMAGTHAPIEKLNKSQRQTSLEPGSGIIGTFPAYFPSFCLNKHSIKAFNFLYYNKNIKKVCDRIVHYDSFFYPLDRILDWNKGYGKRGFVQYQFVLPIDVGREGMTEILLRIKKRGMGSFLAVFKIFGKQNGLISFPMEGCTLALDFPVCEGLFPFLDELDRIVLEYGGRLYLTKDARMKPEVFWSSYPGAEEFHLRMKKYNPDYRFRSYQSDRLEIT